MIADFLIENADSIYTCRGPAPRRGAAQGDAGGIDGGSIASYQGRIVTAGRSMDVRDAVTLDA